MKTRILLLSITVIFSTAAQAVLKEKNLDHTLSILRSELTLYYNDLESQTALTKAQQQKVRNNLNDILNRSSQNSLMLYSQKPEYIFDLTYACHEATEQYAMFQKSVKPFVDMLEHNNDEIARYDSLIVNLSEMHTYQLSKQGQTDRQECLTLAESIRHTLNMNSQEVNNYIHIYELAEQRLKRLNDYALQRYHDIQRNIFYNSGDNYFHLLQNLTESLQSTRSSITYKYVSVKNTDSQWNSKWMLYIFVYLFIYSILSLLGGMLFVKVILPYLLPRLQKRRLNELADYLATSSKGETLCQILCVSVVLLAISLGIVPHILTKQNFILMASGLLLQYTWMIAVILISLLIRLHGKNLISTTFRIYAPLIAISLVVITFRIAFVPSEIVNLVFPPLLLGCSFWQVTSRNHHVNNLERSDVLFGNATSCVFIVSMICSVTGYTLLSVQLLIWWMMQLACILTITCIRDFTHKWVERRSKTKPNIKHHWLFRLFYHVCLPVATMWSVLLAIYFAAQVFNLGDTTRSIFTYNFIDSDNFRFSIFGLVMVGILYFVFSYIHHTVKLVMENYFTKYSADSASSMNIMVSKISQIVVWGSWFIISLNIFHVSSTWLVVVTGGLSTGVGFASKDILENIYYGISLMTGRIKIGDLIECDGIRGKVSSISYTSTMIDTIDGSVIAFQNSQLFTKNYKNLTKNEGHELVSLIVGVAYGSNLQQVRKDLAQAINSLKSPDIEVEKTKIVVNDFGDSSVNLKILVWVNVLNRSLAVGEVLETVYDTLNKKGVQIPFPQHDIHIISN